MEDGNLKFTEFESGSNSQDCHLGGSKIKPPGIGPQVLNHQRTTGVSPWFYLPGQPILVLIFDPQLVSFELQQRPQLLADEFGATRGGTIWTRAD